MSRAQSSVCFTDTGKVIHSPSSVSMPPSMKSRPSFIAAKRALQEELLVDVARVEGDEALAELLAEGVDLGEDVGHVGHVAHGERRVDLAHVAA